MAEFIDVIAQETTTSDEENEKIPEVPQRQDEVERRAKILRRIGYGIFGGFFVLLTSFLIGTTFDSIGEKTVYDPFTGQNVMQQNAQSDADSARQ